MTPAVRRWLAICATAMAGAAAALVLQRVGWPLPWILGPLIAAAIVSIAGVSLDVPIAMRRIGQIVIGANIGLSFTAAILERVIGWAPLMVGMSLLAVAIGAGLSIPLSRFGRTDRKTAFFAMLPGGVAEMANIGRGVGAAAAPIALVQAIRVGLVVCLIPPLVAAANGVTLAPSDQAMVALGTVDTALIMAMALAGVACAALVRLNNPWLIGAVAGAAVAAVSGWINGRLETPLYDLGQLLLGLSIGAQFTRASVMSMPRITVASILLIAVLSVLLALVGWLLTIWTKMDFGTAVLATSAGGMAEMSATAISLHFDVALVAGFHFVRVFIINGFALYFWRIHAWLTKQPAA